MCLGNEYDFTALTTSALVDVDSLGLKWYNSVCNNLSASTASNLRVIESPYLLNASSTFGSSDFKNCPTSFLISSLGKIIDTICSMLSHLP